MVINCSIIYAEQIIFDLVDISHCGLTKVSSVMTSITCKQQCWTTTGGDSIYNLTNDSFRVYLNQIEYPRAKISQDPLTVHKAKSLGYKMHYEVKGSCK